MILAGLENVMETAGEIICICPSVVISFLPGFSHRDNISRCITATAMNDCEASRDEIFRSMLLSFKTLAPGEARTLDLRISLSVLTYKYDALTDCATGAMLGRFFPYAKFA